MAVSDWEEINDNSPSNQGAISASPQSEWEEMESPKAPEAPESLLQSLFYSPFRVSEDVLKGLYHVAANTPQYYEKTKEALPALYNELKEHPLDTGKQFTAGLAEEGQNIFNMPHDIANYATDRLHLFPEDWNKKVQMARMPNDTEALINGAFGEPQNLGQQAARFGGRNAEALTAGAATVPGAALDVGRGAYALARGKVDPEAIAEALQQNHDRGLERAGQDFETVGNEVTQRGINQVPNVTPIVDQAANLLPNTRNIRRLIDPARNGDFQALRQLQSELFHRGNKARRSILTSEQDAGDLMHDVRDDINDALSQHLVNTGNPDLNETLNQGRNRYRELQNVYSNRQHPGIKNLVTPREEERIIPDNLMKILKENSARMNRVLDRNPWVRHAVNRDQWRQDAINALKKAAITGATGLVLGEATPFYHALQKYLSGDQNQ